MFIAYAIQNPSGKIYIGHTKDLAKRLARHNNILPTKKTSYTFKHGNHWKVVHREEFFTRALAVQREKELKSSRGREFIHLLLKTKSKT